MVLREQRQLRVFTYQGVSDPAALGLMRWCLENGRLDRDISQATNLLRQTHFANQERIYRGRWGGSAFRHMSPEERQSDSAASALVDRVFGPQFGHLQGPFGPLFRPGTPVDDETFVRQAVIFAAFHHEDLERLDRDQGTTTADFLAAADARAPGWYEQLRDDDAFCRLSAAAPVVLPAVEETEASDSPADLWATSIDLYRLAERRGLVLLADA